MHQLIWAHRNVQPPGEVYIAPGDSLGVTTRCSHPTTRVELRARIYMPGQGVQLVRYFHAPNTDRTEKSETYPLPEGFLLGVSALPTDSSVRRGHLYAAVSIGRGLGTPYHPAHYLVQDYLESGCFAAWPGQLNVPQAGPTGLVRTVVGTDPVASDEISQTVPTNATWELLAVSWRLTTVATVATRRVVMQIFDPSVALVGRYPAADRQSASQVLGYNFGAGVFNQAAFYNEIVTSLPVGLILPGGYIIGSLTENFQSGDNFQTPYFHVREWIQL